MSRVLKFLFGWLADFNLRRELIDLRADNKRVKALLRQSEEKNRNRRKALANMQDNLERLHEQLDKVSAENDGLAMCAAEAVWSEPDDKDAEILLLLLQGRIAMIEEDRRQELDLLSNRHNAETERLRAMLSSLQASVAATEAMKPITVKVPEHLLQKIGICPECHEPKYANGQSMHKIGCRYVEPQ